MSEDSDRSVAVFIEALQHPMSERGAFLDRACAGGNEMRLNIEDLLRAHERVGGFMETPLVGPGFPAITAQRIDEELQERNANNGESNNA
jgi:hypothetical protein